MARKRRKKSANMEIAGVILMAFGAILAFGIYFGSAGMLGVAFQNVCLGLFGTLSYALPPAIIALGVYVEMCIRDRSWPRPLESPSWRSALLRTSSSRKRTMQGARCV